MPNVGYLSIERFFEQVQLNMPPATKTDCKIKKHLSVARNEPFATVEKEFGA
jgi:hypothetical protein